MNQNAPQRGSERQEEKKRPNPVLLNILQDRFGEKTVPIVATILFLLVIVSLTSLHPAVSITSAVLAVILARDILLAYAPRNKREPGYGAKLEESSR